MRLKSKKIKRSEREHPNYILKLLFNAQYFSPLVLLEN
jgi:hypothetical protein